MAGSPDRADAVLGRLMLSFDGLDATDAAVERLAAAPAAGVTLFRYLNVASAGQVRSLTDALQRAAASRNRVGALLVAADQEGGQLIALGADSTAFPGNMALGATGDAELSEAVGRAIGREALAMGVNVVYAPSCDLASNPENPGLGIRSFGSEPEAVAELAAAFVRGLRSAGVAATAKHFPGLGDVALDSHLGLAAVDHGRDRLESVELLPFAAAVDAGADLVMSAHAAMVGLTGDPTLPATLSSTVMGDVLRGELGFEGITITDALDMAALPQGPEQVVDAIAAIRAGVDLLLLGPSVSQRTRIENGLAHAARRGLFDDEAMARSHARIAALRGRLRVARPDLDLVGGPEHRALAREVADRSVTLVRDDAGLLPLRLSSAARILAVMPAPVDLTPADTSSTVVPGLAAALRRRHATVDEIVTGHPPTPADIAAVAGRAAAVDLVVVGTLSASLDRAQADLVTAILGTATPTITVALRTPWDLAAYPASTVHAATYGIHAPSLDALADALFDLRPFSGRLPVAIPGIAPVGHAVAVPA
ncbi:MAG TPA: glycoside hydrolase family 3 N-terminal domain-containing protein [Vitreimonas sp.]|nr:glycoside hydrolase family 3 N-terminal domain-containing protein [Vitreimonas sp.]